MITKLDFSVPVDPARPTDLCADIYSRFIDQPELVAVPVVGEDGTVVGLLRRVDFLLQLSGRFGWPLFEKRPVTALMDDKPLCVDRADSVESLNALLVNEQQDAIQHGFVVTDEGKYFGVGTANSLLRANMEAAHTRLKALELAKLEVEAANKAKTNFLANMSHELRTPLNAIIGFSSFILSGSEDRKIDGTTAQYVTDIKDSGEHLLSVINSILDMSKLEANAFQLREDYEDPEEIVQHAIRMVRAQAASSGVALECHCQVSDVELMADRQVILQVMLNLLSNAIKFSPEGSMVRVDLCYAAPSQKGLVIRISDSGIGMAPEDLEAVMRPFVQAESYTTRAHQGTGLGLPLVKAFVEAHDGQFRLESALGVGTTAIIELPPERVSQVDISRFNSI